MISLIKKIISEFLYVEKNGIINCIRIETTNVCNLRCKMCFQSTENRSEKCIKDKGFMKSELFRKIIDQISEDKQLRSVPIYLHIGGEPLLHPKLIEFIHYASKKNIKSILVTNATRLDKTSSEALIKAGLYKIEFSFEGFDKKNYEKYRIGSNFELVKNNISTFLKTNKKNNNKVMTELVVVDLPWVSNKIKTNFIKKMEGKFDKINLSGYFDWLGKVEGKDYKKGSYRLCSALKGDLNVLYDGTVVPCCMDVYGEIPLGDFKTMSIKEILNSVLKKDLKKKIYNKNLKGLLCSRCINLWGGR